MFWNGEKEVTKDELKEFFHSQFTYWGVSQVWTNKPEHFMEVDYAPWIYVIVHTMDDFFDTVPITNCLSKDDTEDYGLVRVESISTMHRVDFSNYTLVWEDGDWVYANYF